MTVVVHPDADRALSDGQQTLTLDAYKQLASELVSLHELAEKFQDRGP